MAVDARHGGPLAAVNLVGTGELYAYAFLLVSHLLKRQGVVRQLHIDIMCKWRPWCLKVLDLLHRAMDSDDPVVQQLSQQLMANNEADLQAWRNMRMVNAAAHGSLHSQSCQVTCDMDPAIWQLQCLRVLLCYMCFAGCVRVCMTQRAAGFRVLSVLLW